MSQDVDNSSKEIEKKNQIEIVEWKSTIIELNSLKRLNIRFELAEGRISKLKRKKSIEITQSEEQKSPKIHELVLKGEIDNSNIIVGDFNTPLSIVDKPTRQQGNGRLEQYYKPTRLSRHL